MSTTFAESRRSGALIDGEFAFTRRDFDRIATMLRAETGIHLPPGKAALCYSRVAKRVRANRCRGFAEYLTLIEDPRKSEERAAMISALTTNVTRFFREPHHFEHFARHIAPELGERARAGERVRLWSAACSTGEEPYSLAITLLQTLPDATRHDVRILATDIDPEVLRRAREGVYSAKAVAPIAAPMRDRWLDRTGHGEAASFRVKDAVKELIRFNHLNLIGEWPMRGRFDVVLCRNVVIYFEDHVQAEVWRRLRTVMASRGVLYVGHSERADAPGLAAAGHTIYRATD